MAGFSRGRHHRATAQHAGPRRGATSFWSPPPSSVTWRSRLHGSSSGGADAARCNAMSCSCAGAAPPPPLDNHRRHLALHPDAGVNDPFIDGGYCDLARYSTEVLGVRMAARASGIGQDPGPKSRFAQGVSYDVGVPADAKDEFGDPLSHRAVGPRPVIGSRLGAERLGALASAIRGHLAQGRFLHWTKHSPRQFLHHCSDLDTLGFDKPEPNCRRK